MSGMAVVVQAKTGAFLNERDNVQALVANCEIYLVMMVALLMKRSGDMPEGEEELLGGILIAVNVLVVAMFFFWGWAATTKKWSLEESDSGGERAVKNFGRLKSIGKNFFITRSGLLGRGSGGTRGSGASGASGVCGGSFGGDGGDGGDGVELGDVYGCRDSSGSKLEETSNPMGEGEGGGGDD